MLVSRGALPESWQDGSLSTLFAAQTGLSNGQGQHNSRGEHLPEHLEFDRCV